MDEALKQLHDLHLPVQPGLWPPAPGWWVLAAVSLGFIVWRGLRWYRTRQQRRPFRIAMKMLDRLLLGVRSGSVSIREFADSVNAVLKRALIHGARRGDSAPLTGAAWLSYLDQIAANNTFTTGAGTALGNNRFERDFHADPAGLHAAAIQVLRALYAKQRSAA